MDLADLLLYSLLLVMVVVGGFAARHYRHRRTPWLAPAAQDSTSVVVRWERAINRAFSLPTLSHWQRLRPPN